MAITDLMGKRSRLHFGFLGSTEAAARDVLENVINKKPEIETKINLGGRTAKDTHKRKTKAQGRADKLALRKKQDARIKAAIEKERLRMKNNGTR